MESIDKKVTIILLISFQLSYNKVDKDLYNPIWNACLLFLFSALNNVKFPGGIYVWFE